MLKYLIISDPTKSTTSTDLWKSLLLYHEFGTLVGSTTSEKLNRLGMIHGIWRLTRSSDSGDGPDDLERVIELDNEIILVIQVESRFFVCCSVSVYDDEAKGSTVDIPYQFYLSHMWLSYRFFALLFGEFSKFETADVLTDALNEHFVQFWSDVCLKPELLVRRGVEVLWHDAYKVAELSFSEDRDQSQSESDVNSSIGRDDSWETIISREILLQEESYLGIKDILVYHLPQCNDLLEDRQPIGRVRGAKSYGFVKNFSVEFESLPDVSNWIYHLHSAYGHLSEHVLAGNVHYEEQPAIENTEPMSTGHDNIDRPPDIHAVAESDRGLNFTPSLGRRLLDGITFPMTLANDALHEVGETTGISTSLNFLKDRIPGWSSVTGDLDSNSESGSSDRPQSEFGQKRRRYGFLISPLALEALPMNYKVRKLHLKMDLKWNIYDVLFWYYEDILVVLICDPKFEKIWDRNYLNDLSYTLSRSMEQLYANVLRSKNPSTEMFSYLVVDRVKNRVRSSLPRCYGLFDTGLANRTKVELVSAGNLDLSSQLGLLGDQDEIRNHKGENGDYKTILSNIDILGAIFRGNKGVNKGEQTQLGGKFIRYKNFLNFIEPSNQWQLQKAVLSFMESLHGSKMRDDIVEEKLLTLGNGILCYLKENDLNFTLILKNWLDEKTIEGVRRGSRSSTLFASLGSDVMEWSVQTSDT